MSSNASVVVWMMPQSFKRGFKRHSNLTKHAKLILDPVESRVKKWSHNKLLKMWNRIMVCTKRRWTSSYRKKDKHFGWTSKSSTILMSWSGECKAGRMGWKDSFNSNQYRSKSGEKKSLETTWMKLNFWSSIPISPCSPSCRISTSS